MTMNDATLDKAILKVCNTIAGDANKSSVTIYYLQTEKLAKLGVLPKLNLARWARYAAPTA